jgi:hypothetical protein
MDVDLWIAIPRQPPVLQEHQSLIRLAALFMTCGGARGAQWSVDFRLGSVDSAWPELSEAFSGRGPSGAAGQLPGGLSSREARPARADRSARVAPLSGHGASGHRRRRRGSTGVRG